MGNYLWRRSAWGRGGFAEASANCTIDSFLERYAKLLRAPLQQPREIVIEG
jgi:hypothetical protein